MEEIQSALEEALYGKGASLIGYADLRELPAKVTHSLPFALSIAFALNPRIIKHIIQGPDHDYLMEYKQANERLSLLASCAYDLLKDSGYKAEVLEPTVDSIDNELKKSLRMPLPHKTVATRAGLGWIGKNALVITNQFGSAVRFASVLTDAELKTGNPCNDSRCGECTKCVEICPAHAPSGRNWNVTMDRNEFFDAHACYHKTTEFQTEWGWDSNICGICIAVCPWTQKYISR